MRSMEAAWSVCIMLVLALVVGKDKGTMEMDMHLINEKYKTDMVLVHSGCLVMETLSAPVEKALVSSGPCLRRKSHQSKACISSGPCLRRKNVPLLILAMRESMMETTRRKNMWRL